MNMEVFAAGAWTGTGHGVKIESMSTEQSTIS